MPGNAERWKINISEGKSHMSIWRQDQSEGLYIFYYTPFGNRGLDEEADWHIPKTLPTACWLSSNQNGSLQKDEDETSLKVGWLVIK